MSNGCRMAQTTGLRHDGVLEVDTGWLKQQADSEPAPACPRLKAYRGRFKPGALGRRQPEVGSPDGVEGNPGNKLIRVGIHGTRGA